VSGYCPLFAITHHRQ